MNTAEWREWFRYLQTRFPAVNEELSKVSGVGEQPSRKDILAAWASAMADCGLSDAKDAVNAIHAGTEKKPYRVEDWPGSVAILCRKYVASRREVSRQYHDGERAVRCRDCGDDGWVVCWSPASLKVLASGAAAKPGQLATCAVPCHCESGLRHIDKQRRDKAERYDAAVWLRIDWIEDGRGMCMPRPNEPLQQQTALEWLAGYSERRVKSRANYEPAFEE